MIELSKQYIIDTNKRAEFFQREMMAYIMGVDPRYNKYVKYAENELDSETIHWLRTNTVEHYEHPYKPFCFPYPNPNYAHDGTGQYFTKKYWFDPENKTEIIKLLANNTNNQYEKEKENIKYIESKLIQKGWMTQKEIDERKILTKEMHEKNLKRLEEFYQHPQDAYLSVIFEFHEDPSNEILKTIRERAEKFCKFYYEQSQKKQYEDFKIESMRIKTTKSTTEYLPDLEQPS